MKANNMIAEIKRPETEGGIKHYAEQDNNELNVTWETVGHTPLNFNGTSDYCLLWVNVKNVVL